MSNYSKPKSPLKNKNNYIYPLTTADQILVGDKRLPEYSIVSNREVKEILHASQWIDYKQSIVIDNLTEDYNVRVKLLYTDDYDTDLLINENAAYIKYAKQDDNKITFYCLDSQPQVDIPIELEVYI